MELVYDFFQTNSLRAVMTTTYYAAFRRPGALWNPDKTARDQLLWNEHAQFMDAMFESGAVILGGPFTDGTGSLVIVTAHSVEQVHEMFRSDPWTERDVLRMGDVKEWVIFLDARERN